MAGRAASATRGLVHGQYNTLGGLETQLVYGELYGSRADILVTGQNDAHGRRMGCEHRLGDTALARSTMLL